MRTPSLSDPDALARWLAAERDGRTEDAEAAAAELFHALPPLAPPAGFAARVLLRAGREGALPQAAPRWHLRWAPLGLAALGIGVGWAFLWVPAVLGALRDLWSPADLIEGAVSRLVSIHLWLSPALGVVRQVAVLWQSLAEPFKTVPVLALGGLCVLVAAVALGILRQLVQSDRRWVYVDPI